jgi:hypothetical protein
MLYAVTLLNSAVGLDDFEGISVVESFRRTKEFAFISVCTQFNYLVQSSINLCSACHEIIFKDRQT